MRFLFLVMICLIPLFGCGQGQLNNDYLDPPPLVAIEPRIVSVNGFPTNVGWDFRVRGDAVEVRCVIIGEGDRAAASLWVTPVFSHPRLLAVSNQNRHGLYLSPIQSVVDPPSIVSFTWDVDATKRFWGVDSVDLCVTVVNNDGLAHLGKTCRVALLPSTVYEKGLVR